MTDTILKALVSSTVFSLLGIVILLVVFITIEKLTPDNLVKEILEKRNVALAIISGCFIISIAIIIAASIHG